MVQFCSLWFCRLGLVQLSIPFLTRFDSIRFDLVKYDSYFFWFSLIRFGLVRLAIRFDAVDSDSFGFDVVVLFCFCSVFVWLDSVLDPFRLKSFDLIRFGWVVFPLIQFCSFKVRSDLFQFSPSNNARMR